MSCLAQQECGAATCKTFAQHQCFCGAGRTQQQGAATTVLAKMASAVRAATNCRRRFMMSRLLKLRTIRQVMGRISSSSYGFTAWLVQKEARFRVLIGKRRRFAVLSFREIRQMTHFWSGQA